MEESELLKQKISKLMAKEFHENYFPDYWLSFIVLGPPAEENCVDIFRVRSASTVQTNILSVKEVLNADGSRGQLSRANRRTLDKMVAGASGPGSTRLAIEAAAKTSKRASSPSNSNQISIVLSHQASKKTKYDTVNSRLRTLKNLKLMTNNESTLRKIEIEIAKCAEEIFSIDSDVEILSTRGSNQYIAIYC